MAVASLQRDLAAVRTTVKETEATVSRRISDAEATAGESDRAEHKEEASDTGAAGKADEGKTPDVVGANQSGKENLGLSAKHKRAAAARRQRRAAAALAEPKQRSSRPPSPQPAGTGKVRSPRMSRRPRSVKSSKASPRSSLRRASVEGKDAGESRSQQSGAEGVRGGVTPAVSTTPVQSTSSASDKPEASTIPPPVLSMIDFLLRPEAAALLNGDAGGGVGRPQQHAGIDPARRVVCSVLPGLISIAPSIVGCRRWGVLQRLLGAVWRTMAEAPTDVRQRLKSARGKVVRTREAGSRDPKSLVVRGSERVSTAKVVLVPSATLTAFLKLLSAGAQPLAKPHAEAQSTATAGASAAEVDGRDVSRSGGVDAAATSDEETDGDSQEVTEEAGAADEAGEWGTAASELLGLSTDGTLSDGALGVHAGDHEGEERVLTGEASVDSGIDASADLSHAVAELSAVAATDADDGILASDVHPVDSVVEASDTGSGPIATSANLPCRVLASLITARVAGPGRMRTQALKRLARHTATAAGRALLLQYDGLRAVLPVLVPSGRAWRSSAETDCGLAVKAVLNMVNHEDSARDFLAACATPRFFDCASAVVQRGLVNGTAVTVDAPSPESLSVEVADSGARRGSRARSRRRRASPRSTKGAAAAAGAAPLRRRVAATPTPPRGATPNSASPRARRGRSSQHGGDDVLLAVLLILEKLSSVEAHLALFHSSGVLPRLEKLIADGQRRSGAAAGGAHDGILAREFLMMNARAIMQNLEEAGGALGLLEDG